MRLHMQAAAGAGVTMSDKPITENGCDMTWNLPRPHAFLRRVRGESNC